MIVVLAEATQEIEDLLRECRSRGDPTATGLDKRDEHEHYVIRGQETTSVLIAARKDSTTGIHLLDWYIQDYPYREKGKPKEARSRVLIATVNFKQNIGHMGRDIVVAGVHGNYRTMKREWPQAHNTFWNSLAAKIRSHGVNIMAGDFNMCFTQVVVELHKRGLVCDCIAWYPWMHATLRTQGQALGLDSCGIFYIGGNVQVTLTWSLGDLPELTAAVAGPIESKKDLHVFNGSNYPGQHWSCYREKRYKETDADKKLQARLIDLLTPSTTPEKLENIPKREGSTYCAYLRFKQKSLDINEWFVGDNLHNGAHFPLCAFTNNSRARSEEASRARAQKRGDKGKKGEKHQGKGRTAGDKGKSITKGALEPQSREFPPVWDGKGISPRAAVAGISTSGKGKNPNATSNNMQQKQKKGE